MGEDLASAKRKKHNSQVAAGLQPKVSERNKENSEARFSGSVNKNRRLLDQLRAAIVDIDERRSSKKSRAPVESLEQFTSSKKLQRLAKLKVISPESARSSISALKE